MSISSSNRHPIPTNMDIFFNLNLLADQAQRITQNTDTDVGDTQAKPSVTTTTSSSKPHTKISCDKPELPGTSSKKRKNNHEHTYLLPPDNRPPNPIASTSSETASPTICVMKCEDIPVKEPNNHGFLIDPDATDSELFHLLAFNNIPSLKANKHLPNYTLCNFKLNEDRYYNKILPDPLHCYNPTYNIIRDLIAPYISIFPKPNDKNFEYPYPFKISHLPSMNAYQLSFNPDRTILYKLISFTADNTEYIKLCPICVSKLVHLGLAYT